MTLPPDNRFERGWQKLKAQWRAVLVRGVLSLLAIEIAVTSIAATSSVVFSDSPAELVLREFLVTRLALSWWMPSPLIDSLERETGARLRLQGSRPADTIEDSLLGWRNRPSTLIFYPGGMAGEVTWRATDRLGFILNAPGEAPIERAKPAGEFRIVVLGGSTVAGTGANSFESISANLQRQLGVRVVNAGVGGYASAQELLYAVSEILSYEPDLIIVYDGWNDQLQSEYPLVQRGGGPDLIARTGRHESISRALNSSTTVSGAIADLVLAIKLDVAAVWRATGLAHLAANARATRLELMERLKVWMRGDTPTQFQPSYYPEVARGHVANLDAILALALARGINVATFLQPIIGIDDKVYVGWEDEYVKSRAGALKVTQRRQYYDDVRRELAVLAERHADTPGVCISDISRVFAGIREALYVDSGHINARGNALVAHEITQRLESCGLLPLAQRP